jgi:metabolite-proton symporter
MPVPGSSRELFDRQLQRAVIASTFGTAIEWYDFFLYSTVTGLIFPQLFFPRSDPAVGLLQSFGVYAVGFVARPIGAGIFGHCGDRIGRKSTLIATLMLMGFATFLVGFVPSYEHIGIWGAVILTCLRFIQGVGVGGEWGGSVLLSMEWSNSARRRGLIASWPQLGVPCGLFLVNLVIVVLSRMSGDQFLAWGWRVPFWLSIVLVGVGLYIRRSVLETPPFRRLVLERQIDHAPVLDVIKQHPRDIILCAMAKMAEQVPFYIFTAFIFAYGVETLKLPRDYLLVAVMTASVLAFLSIPLAGHISDRVGRRAMYILGVVTMAIFGFIYFGTLKTGSVPASLAVIALSLVPHSMMYGPQAALIAERFPTRLRYSGASLGYQLSSVFSGGPAPIIAAWLYTTYSSSFAIAVYILACAVVSLVALALMSDHVELAEALEVAEP